MKKLNYERKEKISGAHKEGRRRVWKPNGLGVLDKREPAEGKADILASIVHSKCSRIKTTPLIIFSCLKKRIPRKKKKFFSSIIRSMFYLQILWLIFLTNLRYLLHYGVALNVSLSLRTDRRLWPQSATVALVSAWRMRPDASANSNPLSVHVRESADFFWCGP